MMVYTVTQRGIARFSICTHRRNIYASPEGIWGHAIPEMFPILALGYAIPCVSRDIYP